jgi:hypothetical protein
MAAAGVELAAAADAVHVREGLTVAAASAGPQALFTAALGRWTVIADPRDLPLGMAVADAVQRLAELHAKPTRRRRAAEHDLERACIRVITAARAADAHHLAAAARDAPAEGSCATTRSRAENDRPPSDVWYVRHVLALPPGGVSGA